ncbi:MAG: dTDP-4-dehydrorhamnose reductase [Syntrophaceae bacterium]|nr:dTDP-4-dehydrorhamnose reductase [Syntrophaceae bacterium]
MRTLVTGAAGQLGADVLKCLQKAPMEVIGVDLKEVDITDENATHKFLNNCKPDVMVHCAAYTKVDQAEEEAALCESINIEGTRNIATACRDLDSVLCYLSTDYVFDGKSDMPYETQDPPNPISVYGRSKYEGEKLVAALVPKHYILRTSWVFGANGHNFVNTMLRLGKENTKIRVVADQVGSPTYTVDLAGLIRDLIQTGKYGIFHGTNSGFCTWADFAEEIFRQMNWSVTVDRIPTSAYPLKATRPMNSRLSQQCLIDAGLSPLPAWQDGLTRFLREINAI